MSHQYPPALTMAAQVPIFTSLQQGQGVPNSSQNEAAHLTNYPENITNPQSHSSHNWAV